MPRSADFTARASSAAAVAASGLGQAAQVQGFARCRWDLLRKYYNDIIAARNWATKISEEKLI